MDLHNQKRMAAELLKCGRDRVHLKPDRLEDISEAVTRGDIRRLISYGAIEAKPKRGVSRSRALYRAAQKKKGRRRGSAHRKGGKFARFPRKERWMVRIRPIRARLKELRDGKVIDRSTYRMLYLQAKGGMFHNRGHLDTQLRLRGIVKGEAKPSRRAGERRRRRREWARRLILPSHLEKDRPRRKKRPAKGPAAPEKPAPSKEERPLPKGEPSGDAGPDAKVEREKEA